MCLAASVGGHEADAASQRAPPDPGAVRGIGPCTICQTAVPAQTGTLLREERGRQTVAACHSLTDGTHKPTPDILCETLKCN